MCSPTQARCPHEAFNAGDATGQVAPLIDEENHGGEHRGLEQTTMLTAASTTQLRILQKLSTTDQSRSPALRTHPLERSVQIQKSLGLQRMKYRLCYTLNMRGFQVLIYSLQAVYLSLTPLQIHDLEDACSGHRHAISDGRRYSYDAVSTYGDAQCLPKLEIQYSSSLIASL